MLLIDIANCRQKIGKLIISILKLTRINYLLINTDHLCMFQDTTSLEIKPYFPDNLMKFN